MWLLVLLESFVWWFDVDCCSGLPGGVFTFPEGLGPQIKHIPRWKLLVLLGEFRLVV